MVLEVQVQGQVAHWSEPLARAASMSWQEHMLEPVFTSQGRKQKGKDWGPTIPLHASSDLRDLQQASPVQGPQYP